MNTYIEYINNKTKIKQDLARLLNREFNDLTNVSIKELLQEIETAKLTYERGIMRPEVINGHQFLYFNKHEK